MYAPASRSAAMRISWSSCRTRRAASSSSRGPRSPSAGRRRTAGRWTRPDVVASAPLAVPEMRSEGQRPRPWWGGPKQGVHKAMKKSLLMAGALAVAGLAVTMTMPAPRAVAGDQLNITSWGGAYQMSQRKAYFEPYGKETSTKITEEEYNGEIAKIRAMVEAKSVTWDVVDVDSGRAIQ